ncbi:MAG TPA: hypothetical protein VI997_11205 [Candidatus Thermoplasmatota archaeon]|nr:hypothetical protein [Candidatus Thermoplasmatota archaeon]
MPERTNLSDEPALRMKEIKVRIPVSFHVRLHSMKVLMGTPISAAITEALVRYFETGAEDASVSVVERGDVS